MRSLLAASLACVVITAAAFCQEFEVVSIKPNTTGANGWDGNSNSGRLTVTNESLRELIVEAHGIKDYQLEGPEWLGSTHFDIAAKFPEAMPKDPEKYAAVLKAMMQKMLADRFHLAVHREEKPSSVYALTVGKGGVRFSEAADPAHHHSNSKNTHYTGKCITMDLFAGFLSRYTELPTVDMTGLKPCYDLTLDWVPEPRDKSADPPPGPYLREALENQLGLRLDVRKAPVEFLIVDHADKTPTEN